MPWTSHGWWIGRGLQPVPRLSRLDCGGPHLCTVCALEAHHADADAQQPQWRNPVAVTIGVTPEPQRLIRMLRIIAQHARDCRRELAEVPVEETVAALAIIARHADGCADELEALDQDETTRGGDSAATSG